LFGAIAGAATAGTSYSSVGGDIFAQGGVKSGEMTSTRAFAQGGIMPGQMKQPRAFAEGGIMPGQMKSMRGFGDGLPVRSYAMGGVATTPQHAIFAEKPGMAEAFVPLPGVGRGIPVEFKQPPSESIAIVVNYTIQALDGLSVERMLEAHGRKIGDIAAGQIASRANRALVTSIRGASR